MFKRAQEFNICVLFCYGVMFGLNKILNILFELFFEKFKPFGVIITLIFRRVGKEQINDG